MQTEKVSKRALSNKTGLQRKSILNWLNGKFFPRYDALIKLSNFFYVSLNYITSRTDVAHKIMNISEISIDEIHTSFVEKLEIYLKQEGMSKYMLAKKINIGQSTLNRWFNGNSMPETAVLIRISDLMGETIDYLLGLE